MQQMFQQVQKMQADLAKAQEELKHETVEATAGGGAVTVEVTASSSSSREDRAGGDRSGDAEMLSDLVLAAVNQGLQAAQELAAKKLAPPLAGRRPRRAGRLGALGCQASDPERVRL